MMLKRFKDFFKISDKILLEKENIYKQKNNNEINDIKFLLEVLRELIDKNDSYKANVKLVDKEIIISHERGFKQKLTIKDNGEDNDFFLISGVDENGKNIDDMGQQPTETIFIIIAKLFQEI